MGIRLSLRKKNIQSEEFCLGKLYYYIDTKEEAESCESIKYLLDLGALQSFFEEYDEYDDNFNNGNVSDAFKFADICGFSPYQDYGEFFELTKAQARNFITLYAFDKARLYGGDEDTARKQIAEAFAFMDRQSSLETSIFEFRLGA